MKTIQELIIPENDAENFKNRDKKQIFNELFIAKENLDIILESNKYFLIGEKGTGKTSYAVFLVTMTIKILLPQLNIYVKRSILNL